MYTIKNRVVLAATGILASALVGCCFWEADNHRIKAACPPAYTYKEFKPRGQVIEEHYPIAEAPYPVKITSGGRASVTDDGRLFTLQDNLDPSDRWYTLYQKNSDTLFGRRPQNIFRALIDTCLLSTSPGFFMEVRVSATDFEPPDKAAYQGGFDLVAQWWSPKNQNSAFLCREDYGGFCGNVGYHAKIQTGGGFEIAKERPTGDNVVATRYTTLDRVAKGLILDAENKFPLNQHLRLRLEVRQISPSSIKLTACFDRDDDGVWDVKTEVLDEERALTGNFVPIIRSDWVSAEFSSPAFGPLSPDQKSCRE